MKPVPHALVAAAILLTGGCHSPETREKIEKMQNGEVAGSPTAPQPGRAFSREEKTPLLDFSYEWPAEAAAIPALVERFTRDMDSAHKEAVATAQEDEKSRKGIGVDFNNHSFERSWSTAGQSPALLSLMATTSVFTGGTHPNHGSTALLWDRKANREMKASDLFAKASDFTALLNGPWCKGIEQARLERRQGERIGGEFDICPPLSDISVIPADTDNDGKFDRLRFLADPYVAGPYAEGDYEVAYAIEPSWIAAMKPEWRDSFERP